MKITDFSINEEDTDKNLAANLAQEALKKGSYDNVSIIILEFE